MGFLSKLMNKDLLKGISSFIGACLINFIAGAIYSLCTLSVYEISYIKAKGGSVNIDHLSFYYPIETFFQCVSSFLSGIIYKELGLHLTNLLGTISLCFGYLLMYLSSSLFLDLISMILGGIGTGIILYPATANTYNWFKDHIGIIVGIMETMISLGSFFFALMGEKIINKDEIQSNDDDNLYDYKIAKKIKDYLLIQLISLISIFLLSLILVFEKKEENESEIISNIEKTTEINTENKTEIKDENNISKNDDSNINIENAKESKSNEENNLKKNEDNDSKDELNKNEEKIEGDENLKINDEKKKEETNSNPSKNNKEKNEVDDLEIVDGDEEDEEKKRRPLLSDSNDTDQTEVKLASILKFAIKSKRLILFISIIILQAPISNMAFTLYREIGEYKKIDIGYLQLVGSFYFIFEMFSSLVFGILCDYIQIKYLLYFINAVGTLFGFFFCFTFKNPLLFLLIQNLLSFSSGGYDPIRDCYLMKVFGEDVYIELNGYVSFVEAVCFNLITPITYFIESAFDSKDTAYWVIFVSFGILNLFALILTFFLKETAIDLKGSYIEKSSKALNISLSLFHNSYKNSFHTSFHMV